MKQRLAVVASLSAVALFAYQDELALLRDRVVEVEALAEANDARSLANEAAIAALEARVAALDGGAVDTSGEFGDEGAERGEQSGDAPRGDETPWPDAPTDVGADLNRIEIRRGSVRMRTAGQVLENTYIEGGVLVVEAANVVLRNCVIDGTDSATLYGVDANKGQQYSVTLEDCTITGHRTGVVGYNVTLRRCLIYELETDAMKPFGNWQVEDCFVEKVGTDPEAHADGLQMVGGKGITVLRTNFHMPINSKGGPGAPYKSNANAILQTNNAPLSDVEFRECRFDGGNFSVYVRDKGNGFGVPTDIRFIDNAFTENHRYGPTSVTAGSGVTWQGNYWEATGEPVAWND